ncbi:MAG TPA: NAD(P)H-dependent oxidoreductase [Kiritimatiellia bacterium]|nr:NAD(P)H-dependent oxidoreductase [Kiritimatiellia bacterium]
MSNILIVYATDSNSTKKAAEAVAKGAASVAGTTVVVKTAETATAEDVLAADGVIVGTPVHMGSPDWRIKSFIDKVCSGLWMKDSAVGKVAGVFATGSGYGNGGGGVELTLLSLLSNFAELGMIIVPLPKNTPGYHKGGIQWGAYGRSMGEKMEQTGLPDDRLEAAIHHGANIARVAATVKGKKLLGG